MHPRSCHPHPRRTARQVIALAMLCLAAAVQATPRIEVFELDHWQAEAVLPLVEPHLADAVQLTATGHRLIASGEPGELERLRRLLAELDRPRASLVIRVRRAGTTRASDGWRLSTERVQGGEQRLRVLEGSPALIHIGRREREMETRAVGAGDQLLLVRSGRDIETGEGFRVFPRLAGDEARLSIEPYRVDRADDGALRIERATTEIRVPLGEWVPIVTGESGRREIPGGQRWSTEHRAGDDRRIEIRVERVDS